LRVFAIVLLLLLDFMRVLVIGGSQFNGFALVAELVRRGHQVTVLNRGQTQANFPPGVRQLIADRTDRPAMQAALGEAEFDCVQDMCAYHPQDVELVVELLAGRTRHYIFASSTAIYAASNILPITEDHPVETGPAQIEYGLHKILCEQVLLEAHRSTGFPATIAAFSMVFGPRNIIPDREQRMLERILTGRPVLIPGDGTTLLQVGHVGDQARALEAMMCQPQTIGQRYNLSGSQYITDEGYVDAFAEVLGREANKVFIAPDWMDALWDGQVAIDPTAQTSAVRIDIRSSEEARSRRASTAVRYKLATIIQRLAPNIHRWNHNVFFGIDKLRRDVGFEPEFSLVDMIAEVRDWMEAESIRNDFDWTLEDQILELVSREAR